MMPGNGIPGEPGTGREAVRRNTEKQGFCLIISGGEYCPVPEDLRCADYVIACDKGYEYAKRMGIVPDRIIGDFDSAPLPDTQIPVDRAPTHKDDTDTMLGMRHALEMGYRDIVICCAFGGRMDHAFANIQTGTWAAVHGGTARILGNGTDALIFAGRSVEIPRREGWSLSVFSLSDQCSGVTITGTKYECADTDFYNTFCLGVSNVWASDTAVVQIKEGIAMVMLSKLKAGEHI